MKIYQVEVCDSYSENIHLLFMIEKNIKYCGSVHGRTFKNYDWVVCGKTILFWSDQ
jgi:hypothetical protein